MRLGGLNDEAVGSLRARGQLRCQPMLLLQLHRGGCLQCHPGRTSKVKRRAKAKKSE